MVQKTFHYPVKDDIQTRWKREERTAILLCPVDRRRDLQKIAGGWVAKRPEFTAIEKLQKPSQTHQSIRKDFGVEILKVYHEGFTNSQYGYRFDPGDMNDIFMTHLWIVQRERLKKKWPVRTIRNGNEFYLFLSRLYGK